MNHNNPKKKYQINFIIKLIDNNNFPTYPFRTQNQIKYHFQNINMNNRYPKIIFNSTICKSLKLIY